MPVQPHLPFLRAQFTRAELILIESYLADRHAHECDEAQSAALWQELTHIAEALIDSK